MLEELYDKSKKSLETILREKAYDEVKDALKEKGISIEDVSDEDVETLVAEKVKLMQTGLKGVGAGLAIGAALSLLTGGI